jgi:hypothetical protein
MQSLLWYPIMANMTRALYSDSISNFLTATPEEILGHMTDNTNFPVEQNQRNAWREEIRMLKTSLSNFQGSIYFEYSIPRMGKYIDVVLLIGPVIFVLEFKIGETEFKAHALDQVCDYALDLKYFHESSQNHYIAPILIATNADCSTSSVSATPESDNLLLPIKCNRTLIPNVIKEVLQLAEGSTIDKLEWDRGRYCPTPTIIEAAIALYNGHTVADISRSDASATNLHQTSQVISDIINDSRLNKHKSICFVTGVPGAGKTLIGLNIANLHYDKSDKLYSVFLSGNDPLVMILTEALAQDNVRRDAARGIRTRIGKARSAAKARIQNIRHFRDDCLEDPNAPIEHVALFDEAQRAWSLNQTANFMKRRRNTPNFNKSEPEFLISCLDRHSDWATIVCLVGGGQEINTGEAGITEWIDSLNRSFPDWHIYISSRLSDSEYGAGKILKEIKYRTNVKTVDDLHLAVSMRSFRAENVSLLVKQLLDLNIEGAHNTLTALKDKYPIVITRDLLKAKQWLKRQARGSERYGIVASSQAERLKPQAIDVKSPMDPIHWFLDGKEDVRSSYYLEDVATEFDIQGLELDWACITWDADFRHRNNGWDHKSFCGDRWRNIHKKERQNYQKNAYRVLLTRARQGMVIVVPEGDEADLTRKSEFYDPTFEYLKEIGFHIID